MSSNWHTINSNSRIMVEQRRQEAEEYRLAQIATGQVERAGGRKQPRGGAIQMLRGLIAHLRVARLGV